MEKKKTDAADTAKTPDKKTAKAAKVRRVAITGVGGDSATPARRPRSTSRRAAKDGLTMGSAQSTVTWDDLRPGTKAGAAKFTTGAKSAGTRALKRDRLHEPSGRQRRQGGLALRSVLSTISWDSLRPGAKGGGKTAKGTRAPGTKPGDKK